MGAWATGIVGRIFAIGGLAFENWGDIIVPVIIAVVVTANLLRQAKFGRVYQRSLENYHRARQEIRGRMPPES